MLENKRWITGKMDLRSEARIWENSELTLGFLRTIQFCAFRYISPINSNVPQKLLSNFQ
jgi:hypothetical protein